MPHSCADRTERCETERALRPPTHIAAFFAASGRQVGVRIASRARVARPYACPVEAPTRPGLMAEAAQSIDTLDLAPKKKRVLPCANGK
jgi:hypothetical protein